MRQRILAVDDEPDMLRLLGRILKGRTPYQVETTINPLEVPQLLQANPYDVIITDMRMRGLDGLDILRLVHDGQRGEKVIVITAFGSLDSMLEAQALGAFRYLIKPFKKEQLLAAVAQAMQQLDGERRAEQLAGLLQREPYARAQAEFQEEYVRALTALCGGDLSQVVQRSGLPANTVKAILEA
jgi:DNA-binding NtrC family response regulator